VNFAAGAQALWAEPERVLLEVGPGTTLGTFARQQAPADRAVFVVATLRHPREADGDLAVLLGALGRLWVAGARVDASRVFAGEERARVDLPTYPFERERYWVDPDPRAMAQPLSAKKDPAEWFSVPIWKAALPPAATAATNGHALRERWLFFVDEGGAGEKLVERIRQQGDSVITVRPGSILSGNARAGFVIDPRRSAHYEKVLETISEDGRGVDRIVHGFAVGPRPAGELTPEAVAAASDQGFYSVLYLAKALAEAGAPALQLKVLTSGMHDVLRGDVPQPEKSPVLGLVKVIPQEQLGVTCGAVDVEPPDAEAWNDPAALDAVVAELRASVPGEVVAVRQGQRFVHGFEPVRLEPREGRPLKLREGGVYLITGGLGGVTFVLGAYLAHVAKAKLVLTARGRLPERASWAAWREAHGDADPVSQRILRVQALEGFGAEVMVVAADVGDAAQMQEAVRQAEERFGALHGVIHGAGVVGGATFRPLPDLGPAECEQQFHPKVNGLLVLERVLAGRELDFCVLTSSLSSVLGGLAYGAYAAANVFMDAYTHARNRGAGTRWLSVNWDEWRLVERAPDETGRGPGLAQFALAPTEGADAFGRLLDLAGVSQVVVSTGDLPSRVRQWIRLEGLRRDGSAAAAEPASRHARPHLQNAYIAPATPAQQAIARIWADALGVEKVGIQDNFFDLGGHSLLAIQVVTRIKAELKAELTVATLFEGPTVESLSRLVGERENPAEAFEHSSDRGRKRKEERRRRLDRVEGLA
jgi:acyl transferase domain-containing protein